MTEDETGFEIIEMKLAELYELQLGRVVELLSKASLSNSDVIRKEVAEAREILSEWLWCIEAKDRAHRRIEMSNC